MRVDPNADFWSFAFSQRALSTRQHVTLRFELPVALHVEPLKVRRGGGDWAGVWAKAGVGAGAGAGAEAEAEAGLRLGPKPG